MFLRYTFMTLFGMLCLVSSGQNELSYTEKEANIDGMKYLGATFVLKGDKKIIEESVEMVVHDNGKKDRVDGYELTYFETSGFSFSGKTIATSVEKVGDRLYTIFVGLQDDTKRKETEKIIYSIYNQYQTLIFQKMLSNAEEASEYVSKEYDKTLRKIDNLKGDIEHNKVEIKRLQKIILKLEQENQEYDSLIKVKEIEADSLYEETEVMKKAVDLIKEDFLEKQ
ncbi:hypothetical protein OO013_18920 [Mangrovivirga sp. M17]|uniref:DUF4369 domain-containing protein n=1 Tax=Mangrovivirga halotolerans TaxID=2993936 RepID=A0ABT3RW14_9BACT|nr:hypothetical protein [Mangrovivirga halotolerans]MCX2745961.1 hypothetical protein [Mangrovivirga halotolerans]